MSVAFSICPQEGVLRAIIWAQGCQTQKHSGKQKRPFSSFMFSLPASWWYCTQSQQRWFLNHTFISRIYFLCELKSQTSKQSIKMSDFFCHSWAFSRNNKEHCQLYQLQRTNCYSPSLMQWKLLFILHTVGYCCCTVSYCWWCSLLLLLLVRFHIGFNHFSMSTWIFIKFNEWFKYIRENYLKDCNIHYSFRGRAIWKWTFIPGSAQLTDFVCNFDFNTNWRYYDRKYGREREQYFR